MSMCRERVRTSQSPLLPGNAIKLQDMLYSPVTFDDHTNAHWRLSAGPAMVAGLRDRGTLTVGAAADIIVYDFENLKILDFEVAHDFPGNEWRRIQRASGYRYVLVNGEVTIRDDKETHTFSGRLLRNGRTSVKARSARAA